MTKQSFTKGYQNDITFADFAAIVEVRYKSLLSRLPHLNYLMYLLGLRKHFSELN